MPKELLARIDALSITALDEIIDLLGVYTTDEYDDESRTDKVRMVLAYKGEVSPEEFDRLLTRYETVTD